MKRPSIEILTTIPFVEPILEELRQISPRLKISAEAARRPEDIHDDVWRRVEVLYTDSVLPEPKKVPRLKWIQFHYAGLDMVLESPLLKMEGIQVTTLSGAAAPQVAEFLLTMMLVLGHKVPALAENQELMEWPRDRHERFLPKELRGSTVGIVGYGSVGRELARLLRPLEVKTLAVKRDLMHPEDEGYSATGLGDPNGDLFTRLYPALALASMVKECDYLVVCLPLTHETRNIINETILKAVKPGAYLVHAGRGGTIDPTALATALHEKRLSGAALDVFNEEPLPPGNPLWRVPNLLISPHIAGLSAFYRERAAALWAENLRRYLNGQPLLNRFDRERQY